MTDLADAFAQAQEAALLASESLAQAMGLTVAQVYAGVIPERPAPPYVVLGEDQILQEDLEDDPCPIGGELSSTVHIWSLPEAPENRQARRIAAAVTAVHANLVIAGHAVVVFEQTEKRFSTDPDGSTHGVLVYRYETTPL